MRHSAIALSFLSLLLGACGAHEAVPAAPAATAASAASATGATTSTPALVATGAHMDAPGIDWFKGDVDAAFAAAKAQHKPVFMYWGAIWCPPCHQLKATVFSRPDFIAKTKLFIPVYLDGDDAGAQKWGEQFKVTGYPTLVVFNDQREEIMRIAGGMDLSAYANVLDLALGDLQPASKLLAAAVGGRALNETECRQLAYTAWGLEDVAASGYATQGQHIAAAAAHCPATATKERARLGYIGASFSAEGEAAALKKGGAPSKALQQQVTAVYALLADPVAAAANADAVNYLGESFFRAVKASKNPAPADFLARFDKAMGLAATLPDFVEADHLSFIGERLMATKTINGQIDPAMIKDARTQLDAALAGNQIPYVRSGVINAALGIFDILGQNDEAYRVVQGELPKTQTPYYYKADLADLAEALGKKDEAVEWARQAYAESQGVATRFQWGRIYLTALLRLEPDDTATIQQVGTQVLGELDGSDRIYQRARLRLATLDSDLRKWSAASAPARAPVLHALRQQLQGTCAKIPAADASRSSCEAFLKGAA